MAPFSCQPPMFPILLNLSFLSCCPENHQLPDSCSAGLLKAISHILSPFPTYKPDWIQTSYLDNGKNFFFPTISPIFMQTTFPSSKLTSDHLPDKIKSGLFSKHSINFYSPHSFACLSCDQHTVGQYAHYCPVSQSPSTSKVTAKCRWPGTFHQLLPLAFQHSSTLSFVMFFQSACGFHIFIPTNLFNILLALRHWIVQYL